MTALPHSGRPTLRRSQPLQQPSAGRAGLAIPQRFHALDVLRGLAALSVVLWHWQHFFLPLNPRGFVFAVEHQPFFALFSLFYTSGSAAVQLFFSLSGFIFFWLYADKIHCRTVSLRSFAVLRLSRLYPLHLATLVFVAAGQLVMLKLTGANFVYRFNDPYHFTLNLLFASSWGFEQGFSFNAPIWSVSVEVLLYALFFVYCKVFSRNVLALVAAIALGYCGYRFNEPVGSGVQCFFVGGLVFFIYEKIVRAGDPWKAAAWLPGVAALAWLGTLWAAGYGPASFLADQAALARKAGINWGIFVLFPVTILALALLETRRGTLGKRFGFIGDISYSSYLLHFPLQLTVAWLAAQFSINPGLFYARWFMLAFFAVLIGVSVLSHRFFERPVQRLFRTSLGKAAKQ